MHLATDRAPCAVTADSDTPLVMNAGPADFSPAKFRKRGPPDPGGLPRYARVPRLSGRLRRCDWLLSRERLAGRALQVRAAPAAIDLLSKQRDVGHI